MTSIFFLAVQHLFHKPLQALCILTLPLALNIFAELFDTHQYVMSYFEGAGYASVLVVVVNFMTTSLIAVAWHRIILLNEPQGFLPRNGGHLYYRYFAQWFVMGLVILFIMSLVVAAFAVIVWLVSNALGQSYLFEDLFMGDELFGTPLYVALTIITAVFTYCLFRFGVVLPHLATGHSEVGMWEGWRCTKPLAWPIAGAAVLAGIGQIALLWLPSDFLMRMMEQPDGYLPSSFDYLDAVVVAISYSLISLFGAAILTEIYTRIDVQSPEVN